MKIPDIIKVVANTLRNNMTKSEVILWNYLKGGKLGVKFLRQKPLYVFTENNGLDRYVIPDFFCFELKIIIEVDGSIHNIDEVYLLDIEKEKLLNNLGYKIIRITNDEVNNNIKNVIQIIKQKLKN